MEKKEHKQTYNEKIKLNVLHIIGGGTVGGAESFLYSLLRELIKFKELNIEVCFLLNEGPFAEKIKQLGIKTYCLKLKNGFDLFRALKLRKLIKQRKYDIVHTHSSQPLVRLMVALSKPKATFFTEHGSVLIQERGRRKLERYYHRFMSSFIDLHIAVSNSIKEAITIKYGVPPDKIKVINTAIDMNNFRPTPVIPKTEQRQRLGLPLNRPIIGAVSRLSPEKGIDHLLLATKSIAEKLPNCLCLIVGDGRLKGELQNQAKTLGISENILFLGERPDVANILSAIDIVVMPSVSDGLPLSALEAMAMGKAIIGYNVGGIPEAVIHNRTGILINKRDPLLLAEGIMTLLSNKHLCQAMGKAGQIRVMDSFNIEVVSRKHRELYSQYFGNYKGLAKLRCRENLLES